MAPRAEEGMTMPKANDKALESVQEAVLHQETSQDTQKVETAQEGVENAAEEAGLVTYRVAAPRGIYLRVGPGRAYHALGVLANGTEVMGGDLSGMLRMGRKPGDIAWIKVTSETFTGWVDASFLERVC